MKPVTDALGNPVDLSAAFDEAQKTHRQEQRREKSGNGNGKAGLGDKKRPQKVSFAWVVKELRARGGLSYDTFINAPFVDGERFSDRDHVGKFRLWFQEKTGVSCGKETMRDALNTVFAENKVNSLRAWFDALEPWDGTPRLDLWLFHVYGVTGRAKYIALIGPAWLMSGVARAYQPGIKVRAILLLSGPEEVGKSESFVDIGVTARNGIYSTLRDRETSKINHLNSIVSSRFRTFIRCSHRTVTY